MKLPSLTKFLDIKDPRESLGPSKIEEIDRDSLGPKEVFMSWEETVSLGEKTPISKRFSRPIMIIGIFVGLLLLIMQEFFVILIIGSLIFFVQAIMKMAPENIKYELSNHGILINDDLYYWDKLRRFFYITREGSEVLAIDTVLGFPGRIYIHFNPEDKEKIKEVINRYLHFLEAEPRTFLDNTYDKVVQRFSFQDDDIPQEYQRQEHSEPEEVNLEVASVEEESETPKE
ncbi:hypothetical protein K0B04_01750 [Patescibacteria group bacterium]|nr:hypothetical protein [Patescibacteria group bacterium]